MAARTQDSNGFRRDGNSSHPQRLETIPLATATRGIRRWQPLCEYETRAGLYQRRKKIR